MDGPAKRKITVKIAYNVPSTSSRPPSRTQSPMPPSPAKTTDNTFRPRAKVNSSATVRKAPSVVSATPRTGSPNKLARAHSGTLSPTFQPRAAASVITARATVRPHTPVSAPGTPEVRQRSLASQSEVGKNPSSRQRHESLSLHHAMSFSSLQTSSNDSNASPPTRIRSKVSNLSKPPNENISSTSLHPSTRPTIQARLRSPSTSSNVSQKTNTRETSSPQQFYPITTSSPAANPHRYGQGRPTPTASSQHAYQGLALLHNDAPTPSSNSPNVNVTRPRFGGTAKVDLTPIPPPPLSPPGSAVSFSSRSSLSISSTSQVDSSPLGLGQPDTRRASGATELYRPQVDADSSLDEGNSGAVLDNSELKVKAEAKTNRKIADLEITNRSLLSINSSLEAAKNKQAKEIRELRRKLRESRLILPHRTYLAVKSSLGPEDDGEDDDEDDDSELEEAAAGDGDEIYKRVKIMLEGLISSGKKALETKVEDFPEGGKGVAKVLTAEEVQSWHRSNTATNGDPDIDNDSELESEADSMSISQADFSISSSVNGDDDDEDISFLGKDTFLKSIGPPIHISEA